MKRNDTNPFNMRWLNSSGFTLIELMIVVLIVAVIAAVAVPNYSQYIVRANRADAADRIAEIMQEQERFQIRQRRYSADLTELGYDAPLNIGGGVIGVPTEEGLYAVSAGNCVGEANVNDCVLLTATPDPNRSQANDGILSLDSRGNRVGPWENN